MDSNQKEILERVLLMMKYDSSKTLNENKKEIRVISEQPDPNDPNIRAAIERGEEARRTGIPAPTVEKIPIFRDSPITMLNWLNKQAQSKSNTYKYSQKQFDGVVDLFLNQLSNMTLAELAALQLSYKRSITPGFIGFDADAKSTGFADVLVDNEIYVRRKSGEQGYPMDELAIRSGQKPFIRRPQYNTLNGEIQLKISPYQGKNAQTILNEKLKKEQEEIKRKKLESDKKAAEQAQKTKENFLKQGCPFGDKKDGDAFRKWYVETYPEIAKTYVLSKSGEFCNTNIKNASKHVLNNKSMIERYYTYINYATLLGGQIEKKQSSKQSGSGCFFKDKRQGDEFRNWFNKNYPSLAAKEKYNLSTEGEFCNTNIKNALNHSITEGPYVGKKIKDIYSEKIKWEFDMTESEEFGTEWVGLDDYFTYMYENSPEEYKKFFEGQPFIPIPKGATGSRKNVKEREKEQWEKWKKSINFKSYPKLLDTYMGGFVWSENFVKITAQDINDPSKTKDYTISIIGTKIDDAIEKFYNSQLQYAYRQSILDDDIIYDIFTKEAIEKAIDGCEEEKVLAFLQAIIDGRVKNKQGQTVGEYYNDSSGRPKIAKWNDATPPCDDTWWAENGLAISLVLMVGTALVTGGLSLGATASFLVNLAVDSAINLYSLKKSYEADDYAAMKMDIAYVFLPFLMASSPVKNLLKKLKYGDDVINSVERKLKSIPSNATKQQVDNILLGMTGEEQRLMRQLGSDEYADIMKQASDDIMKKLKSGAKAGTKATSIPRKLSNPIINIFAYTAPALVYGYTKITEALEDKAGETITQKNRRLWALSLSYFTQQQKDKILKAIDNATPEQAKQILDIVDYSNLGTEAQKAYDNIVSGGKAGVDLELEAKKLEKKMQENNEKWLKTLNLEGTIQVSDTLIKN
jgi:hypothetical protein